MKLFRKIAAPLLVLLLLLAANCQTIGEASFSFDLSGLPTIPYTKVQGAPILHTFGWSFNEIAANIPAIAAAGFGSIQTSPISECVTFTAMAGRGMGISGRGNGAWWYHYQPVSFRIGNYQLGTEAEFAAMCAVAREHNIKVLVDVVPNHFAGAENESQIREEIRNFPGGAYRRENVVSDDPRIRYTQSRLLSLLDTNTHNPLIQQEYLRYLMRCIELGASGFRFDAALHIELPVPYDPPAIASNFWPVVLANGAEFQYGEILNRGGAEMYINFMPVTDSTYGQIIVSALRSNSFDANLLRDHQIRAPAERLVTWVESHDTYYNAHETADLTERQILFGWAILCARNGSTPLFFNRPAGSSRRNVWGNDVIGRKGNDHYKTREIAALNHFKRAMEGTGELFTNPIENNQQILMIQRGSSGAVIINAGQRVTLNNIRAINLVNGVYTDLISGSEFTVTEGTMTGTVNANSVAVFFKQGYPDVSISLASRDFLTNTLDLRLTSANVTSAAYSINNERPVRFTSGQNLTIGANTRFDEPITITLTGEGSGGSVTRVFTYTKRDREALGRSVIYFRNTQRWNPVYCYVYSTSGPTLLQNGNGWPGELMTHVEGNLFKFILPDWDDFHVMFTNNDGDQFPPAQAPGLLMFRGQTMILENNRLVPYN